MEDSRNTACWLLPIFQRSCLSLPACSHQEGWGKISDPWDLSTRMWQPRPHESHLPQPVLLWKGLVWSCLFCLEVWCSHQGIPRWKHWWFLLSHSTLLFPFPVRRRLQMLRHLSGLSVFPRERLWLCIIWVQEGLEMSSIWAFTVSLLLRAPIPLFSPCDSLANMTLIVIGKRLSLWLGPFSCSSITSTTLIDSSLLSLLNIFTLKKKLQVNYVRVERLFPAHEWMDVWQTNLLLHTARALFPLWLLFKEGNQGCALQN